MKNKRGKNNKTLLIGILIAMLLVVTGFFVTNNLSVQASDDYSSHHYELEDIRQMLASQSLGQVRVHTEYGVETHVVPLNETTDEIQTFGVQPLSSNPFWHRRLFSSSHDRSIVIVLMGDGFLSTQQGDWQNPTQQPGTFFYHAHMAMLTMKKTHPFNLFASYFTVYAIPVLSRDSGIPHINSNLSDDLIDSIPIGLDAPTYFGSRTFSSSRVSMPESGQQRARALAMADNRSPDMIQVIANTTRFGGMAFLNTRVALTTVHTSGGGWHRTFIHEFGHTFGWLADVYANARPLELANMTSEQIDSQVKWSHWIGHGNNVVRGVGSNSVTEIQRPTIGVYRGNNAPSGFAVPVPRDTCMMSVSARNRAFCAVSSAELTRRLAHRSDEVFQSRHENPGQTTPPNNAFVAMPQNAHRILPYAFNGNPFLQELIVPSSVASIGDYAFIGANNLQIIRNNATMPQQINETTFAGLIRSNILVFVPQNTYAAYRAAGWTGFLLVEGINPIITPEVGRHRVDGITNNYSHVAGVKSFYFINRWWPFYSHNAYIAIPNILKHQDILFPGRTVVGATLSFNFLSNRNDSLRASVRNTTNPSALHSASVLRTLTVNHPIASSGTATIDVFEHLDNSAPSGGIGLISLYAARDSGWPCGHQVVFSNIRLDLEFAGLVFDGTTVTGFVPPPNFDGTVIIPEGVTIIGNGAFQGNMSVRNVIIANTTTSVTRIEANAFRGSGLESITIASSVIYIGVNAFVDMRPDFSIIWYNNYVLDLANIRGHRLTVIITENTTTIPANEFYGMTGLTEIYVPSWVTEIGANAFAETTRVYWEGRYEFQGNTLLRFLRNENNAIIPSSIAGRSITTIGENAFVNTGLRSIEIPGNVTTIGERAFAETRLTSLTIPSTVAHIGENAFPASAVIIFPDRYKVQGSTLVTYLGRVPEGARWNVAGRTITEIGQNAFQHFSGNEITVPSSVAFIGAHAFPHSTVVTWQERYVFQGNNLLRFLKNTNQAVIPSSIAGIRITSVCSEAFTERTFHHVSIPYGITYIGSGAFAHFPFLSISWNYNPQLDSTQFRQFLTYVHIPNGTTTISAGSFEGAQSLLSIDIPQGVRYIEDHAFTNSGIQIIHMRGRNQPPQSINDTTFAGSGLERIMFYCWESYFNFRNSDYWSNLREIMQPASRLFIVRGGGVPPPAEWGEATDETIRIAVSTDITNFNFFFADPTPDSQILAALLYDRLVDVDPVTRQVVPNLAKQWSTEDAISWFFELRQGIYFNNDAPFNANSIYSFVNFVQQNHQNSLPNAVWRKVCHVVVLGDYSIEIVLKERYVLFLELLATPFAGIVDVSCFSWCSNCCCCECDFVSGTDAFFIEWFLPEQKLVLSRFDYHFRGVPPTKYIYFIPILDCSDRSLSLEFGEVDISLDISTEDAERINDSDNLYVIKLENAKTTFLQFNLDNPVLNDVQVRQAIAHAIDRESWTLNFNSRVSQDHVWGANLASYADNLTREFSPEFARQKLEDAGYMLFGSEQFRRCMDGEPLSLSLLVSSQDFTLTNKAHFIQQSLIDINLNIELNIVTQELFYEYLHSGYFDIVLKNRSVNTLFYLFEMYAYGGALNYGNFNHDELNPLFQQAFYTPDDCLKYSLLQQIQYILSHYLPSLGLSHQPRFIATTNSISLTSISSSTCAVILNLSAIRSLL
ncbi:MAG: leucine-rich repeat protein [Firmicutes bacterium]|nr:leucine-rich repeat protein [Bacillota bacterium]